MAKLDLLGSWWIGGGLLLAGVVGLLAAELRPPTTLTVGIVRRQVTSLPPHTLVTDRARFFGYVLEPLCPPAPGARPISPPPPAVASACAIEGDDVSVTLRPGLRIGGEPADAARVQQAIEAWGGRYTKATGDKLPWTAVEAEHGRLRLKANSDDLQELRASLADVEVAEQDGACVLGTGPWQHVSCDASPTEVPLPPAITASGAATDVVILERRDGLERRRLRFVGLDYLKIQDASGCTAEQAGTRLSRAVYESLGGKPGNRLDVLLGFEALQVREIEDLQGRSDSPKEWAFQSRTGTRVMWAFASPKLGATARVELLRRVREVLGDPTFFQTADGPPSRSLLPPEFAPVHFASPADGSGDSLGAAPPVASADGSAQACPIAQEDVSRAVLTHTFWAPIARRLSGRLGFTPAIVLTDAEWKCRATGTYALSLLTVEPTSAAYPAAFLYAHLTLWADGAFGLAGELRSLVTAEARGKKVDLEPILRALDSFIVPISLPPTWYGIHSQVVGWNADAGRLDPIDATVRDAFWPRMGEFFALVTLLGVLGLGTVAVVRAERVRERDRIASRLAAFHHDLASPLAAIRAEADHLRERVVPGLQTGASDVAHVADVVEIEAVAADSLIDDLRINVDPDRFLRFDSVRQCRMVAEALEPEIDRLVTRAAREEVRVVMARKGPPADRFVAMGPRALRRVLQNLFENAYKFRSPDAALELEVDIADDPRGRTVSVIDHGIGFDPAPEMEEFFEPRHRGERALELGVAGHGLGLSTVQSLVHAVGGRVTIERRANPTHVKVWLPWATMKE